jgi:hypothetical protein
MTKFLASVLVALPLLGAVGTQAATAATLFPGQVLFPGQSLQADDNGHTLVMQNDGNAVLYNTRNGQPTWASNTQGINPRDLIMQADGNLVVYDRSGQPRWASNTFNNPGAYLDVQNDGNLVIYRAGTNPVPNNALWASNTFRR